MTSLATHRNRQVFAFFRRRLDFIQRHAADDTIEAYVLWGVCAAALARVHAVRLGKKGQGDRVAFVTGLRMLGRSAQLSTFAVPLLAHDLAIDLPLIYSGLRRQDPFALWHRAAGQSRVWSETEDRAARPILERVLKSVTSKNPAQATHIRKLFETNRYAGIMYVEYRCCAVHGLDLGLKTTTMVTGSHLVPEYSNYIYRANDPRPAKYRYRTRIVFPLPYLVSLLETALQEEQTQWDLSGKRVPPYSTLLP